MVKSYFRYELKSTFGHANTNKCNVELRKSDGSLAVGSGESLVFLNMLSGKTQNALRFEEKINEISAIRIMESEFETVGAIGYEDGSI